MSFATVFFALLFYAATAIFLIGVGMRIARYARAPAPLKIPTTPAPTTRTGVVGRMVTEVVFFHSLFKANKWIWILGWVFHLALLLVLLRHLRYFIEPVWTWVVLIQPFGVYAGFAMIAGLAGLWVRRLFVERIRYISSPSDHLMLALLIAIAASGLGMKYIWHTDIPAVKMFFMGLMRFDFHPLPTDPMLLIHLSLVAALMIIFPFSKLLHAPGVFFSPTRNQADNPRERRHVTWISSAEKPAAPAEQ
ncbi:nitrate reductase [Thioalkalivibrio denitrificans]|uniref:Nitrate reductase n=1 Tax=Thioalkalivibrio denitrificans TaxID=108003 RepID=A0A1V3NC82_9GAMM|nr:respiratory nitrate reductase subunit gamma [Thioalkalivibrio denitrificans]OOG22468.1 nitrate reductase [Thioalkalivibrio denitrificans]